MTTPSLITAPTSCASGVIMSMTSVIGITGSPFTLEEQAFQWPGEQWTIDFSLPPQATRAQASEWLTFGLKLKGAFNLFLMGDPSARLPRGVASGTPLVDGGAQAIGNTLNTKGWTPSVTGILKKGDYIQIGTGVLSRLHMVLEDVNSTVSGTASLSIAPALTYVPADEAVITTVAAKGVFRMDSNTFSWSVSPGGIYRLGFRAKAVNNA